MRTFPRKSLVLATLLLLAPGLAATAHAQKKTLTEVATITLADSGKFKTAPDGTVSVSGAITNTTSTPLTLCSLAFSIDPDTVSFDDFTYDFDAQSQSFLIAPGETVEFRPINVTVLPRFTKSFFIGYIGAVLTTSDCNIEQIPVGGDMYKIKVR
jgi:hypothetical protein